jgi:hypothetical protein
MFQRAMWAASSPTFTSNTRLGDRQASDQSFQPFMHTATVAGAEDAAPAADRSREILPARASKRENRADYGA